MSVNIDELLGRRVPKWIETYLSAGVPREVPAPFWVVPIEESDPTYDDLCKTALGRLKQTEIIDSFSHESLIFILLKDADGLKVCIGNRDVSLPTWRLSGEDDNFLSSDLNFLQLAHLITKYALPARAPIPSALVNSSPIFEDDLLEYFPEIYVLQASESSSKDSFEILALKTLLALEVNSKHVTSFKDAILDVAYAIPAENHQWIFGQIFSGVRSQRLVNFYLEIYKLFEFFFPLESIFNLADRLGYTESELVLLDYCRGALSWNVNHQRGARAAITYAKIGFAEICLDEPFVGTDAQAMSFKERAVEKLTTARHSLTHQDFRPASIAESDLLRLTAGLLEFLREAFTEYGTKLETRRKRSSSAGLRPKPPARAAAAKVAMLGGQQE